MQTVQRLTVACLVAPRPSYEDGSQVGGLTRIRYMAAIAQEQLVLHLPMLLVVPYVGEGASVSATLKELPCYTGCYGEGGLVEQLSDIAVCKCCLDVHEVIESQRGKAGGSVG